MVHKLDDFLGKAEEIAWVRKQLPQIARSRIPVLIYGDTGTGKTMLAEIIHRLSDRANGPYVHLDCGGMVEDLVANELFGHMRGSYTNADRDQAGLIEQADGGTLFLDELGNLGHDAQTKLLQVLDEGTFRRVGGVGEITVDVRIVGASSRPLHEYVHAGRLRQDLYYRLKGFQIYLPPIRERREDILLLVNHYLSLYCQRYERRVPRLTREAREVLTNYSWPGNVRELERLAEEVASLHQVDHVTPRDLRRLDLDYVLPCWEGKNCESRECPAYGNADYRCWLIDNTLCFDGTPRTVGQKAHMCLDCDVFLESCMQVSDQDGSALVKFLREQIQTWSRQPHTVRDGGMEYHIEGVSFKEFRQRVLYASAREYFASLLRKHGGELESVCRQAGLSKSTVYELLRRHDLAPEDFRRAEPIRPAI